MCDAITQNSSIHQTPRPLGTPHQAFQKPGLRTEIGLCQALHSSAGCMVLLCVSNMGRLVPTSLYSLAAVL